MLFINGKYAYSDGESWYPGTCSWS